MKTVKLITCNDAMKAHILQGALENEGIESILHNENFSTLYKSCVSNIAGVDILVAEEEYDKAIQVLRDNQSWPEVDTLSLLWFFGHQVGFEKRKEITCYRCGYSFGIDNGSSGR